MSRIGPIARRYWFDAVIVLVAIEGMLEVAVHHDDPNGPQTTLWFGMPAVALLVLPLFARRRFPFAVPAVYWLLAAGVSFVDGQLVSSVESIFLLGMAAAFLLGNLRNALEAQVGLGIVVGSAGVIVYNIPDHSASELVFVPMFFGIAWLAGFVLRERAEEAEAAEERAAYAEREREAAARVAVAEERARIARELHDIVAHAVSVMVLQIGAVRHRLPDSLEEDREALDDVERAGRTALAEMRRLLGAMRLEDDEAELAPQPGLDGLESLAEEVGRAGLPVRLHVAGDRIPLPRAIDLSAYRIVQEGLTNALKHARASKAEVTVDYGQGGVRLEVRDDGVGVTSTDGLGHGLVGVRERVKLYGGEMSAGRAPDGGFVLSASLPVEVHTP